MTENSKIEWTDHTFNPWTGCQKVSPACDHCYAEDWDKRYNGGNRWGAKAARIKTSDANWRKPLAWNRKAEKEGVRRKVFCASLADVFDNHGSITSGWHGDLWSLIERTPHLDWLLLTKRPQNIKKMLPEDYGMPAWGDGGGKDHRYLANLYREYLKRPEQAGLVKRIKADLRGNNLACWCRLDHPCHADVLLEIANGEIRRK